MKLLLLLVALLLGFAWFRSEYSSGPIEEDIASESTGPSRHGFIYLPAQGRASEKGVVVIAAENCPESAAQRANGLYAQVQARGLPVTRASGVSFRVENGDDATMQRINMVMNTDGPIVFVNGRAKSNPSYREILAEYGVGE